MVTTASNLHVTARRYCMERYQYWVEQYTHLEIQSGTRNGQNYTVDARSIFPRYHVLSAILTDIERFEPDEFSSFAEAQQFLQIAGDTAQNIFTQSLDGAIEQQVMHEERKRFQQMLARLSEQDVAIVQPLIYRRVLSNVERSTIWARLRSTWGITQTYWYPLTERSRSDLEAFQAQYFDQAISPTTLQTLLLQYGVQRVWELREDGTAYELEVTAVEPLYNGAEGYWCSDTIDWIIYASHENSITIGGVWLLTEIKAVWPLSQAHLWVSSYV